MSECSFSVVLRHYLGLFLIDVVHTGWNQRKQRGIVSKDVRPLVKSRTPIKFTMTVNSVS